MLAQVDESHSGTPGSRATCASPGIFAACHALLRRIEPSHSLGGVKYPVLTQTLNQIALDQTYAKPQSYDELSYFARKVTYELHNMDPTGFEPAASRLQSGRSSTELRALTFLGRARFATRPRKVYSPTASIAQSQRAVRARSGEQD